MTGELAVLMMNRDEAQTCITQIKTGFGSLRETIYDFYIRKGWEAMGYDSFTACAMAQFGASRMTIYRQLRAAREEHGTIPSSREIADLRPEPETRDGRGEIVIDAATVEAFKHKSKLDAIVEDVEAIVSRVKQLKDEPIMACVDTQALLGYLGETIHEVMLGMPYAPCPKLPMCVRGCSVCGGLRWVTKTVYDSAMEDR